jgi:hypothetical protein
MYNELVILPYFGHACSLDSTKILFLGATTAKSGDLASAF